MRAPRFLPAALAASAILFLAATAAADAPPDVVRLKNGGMVRGSIQELVPGQSVDIVLADGSRRHFAAAEVEYAGAAERMPAAEASSAPPAPAAEASRVRFEAAPEVRLHERTGTVEATVYSPHGPATAVGATYTDLCAAPCELTMAPGQHTLAVSFEGRAPIEVPPLAVPPGTATLRATYESRAGVRVAGLVVGLGALVGGSIMAGLGAVGTTRQECQPSFIDGAAPFCTNQRDPDGTLIGAGIAIAVAGSVAGLVMLSIGDHAELRVAPVSLRPIRGKREGVDVLGSSGLGLELKF